MMQRCKAVFPEISAEKLILIGICFYKDFYRRIGPAGFEGVQ